MISTYSQGATFENRAQLHSLRGDSIHWSDYKYFKVFALHQAIVVNGKMSNLVCAQATSVHINNPIVPQFFSMHLNINYLIFDQ